MGGGWAGNYIGAPTGSSIQSGEGSLDVKGLAANALHARIIAHLQLLRNVTELARLLRNRTHRIQQ